MAVNFQGLINQSGLQPPAGSTYVFTGSVPLDEPLNGEMYHNIFILESAVDTDPIAGVNFDNLMNEIETKVEAYANTILDGANNWDVQYRITGINTAFEPLKNGKTKFEYVITGFFYFFTTSNVNP